MSQPHCPVGVGGAGHPAGQPQPQAHPGNQGGAGGDVEPDGVPQAAWQSPADPGRQHHRVPHDDEPDQARPARGQARAAAVNTTQHGQDPEVQGQRPDRGRPLTRAGGVQERDREMLAPDHYGIGGRPQQHQVQRQPAPAGHPVAQSKGHPACSQIGEHEPSHQQMAASSPNSGGALGHHRLAIADPAPNLSLTR